MTTFTKQATNKAPYDFHQEVKNQAIVGLKKASTKEISKKDQQLAKRYLKNLKVNFNTVLHDRGNPYSCHRDAGVCDIIFETSLKMGEMGGRWDAKYHRFVTDTYDSLLSRAINQLLKLHNVKPSSTALNFPVEAIITKSDDGSIWGWGELEELFHDPEYNNFQGDALKVRIQLMNIFVMKFREWFEIVW
ncbi:hypothetical protein [Vibrio sp. 10N.261.46.A3]|uniref:hypothetical protein n=1 Tax=Vibrio sp. 10N.261.46.A3 TaxID=3229658 RepID=UPI00354E7761